MRNEEIALSVDELGMAAILIGEPDFAKTLMFSVFGNVDELEVKSRLAAGGDSLLSKGLVRSSQEGYVLTEEMVRLVRVVTAPVFSIRISRIERESEQGALFHFSSDTIVRQRVEQGMVYLFKQVKSKSEVIDYSKELFQLRADPSLKSPTASFPYYVLEKAKNIAENKEELMRYLIQNGVNDGAAEKLAKNIADADYRGAAMKIEYGEKGLTSERGFLVLGGIDETLLFRIYEEENTTRVEMLYGTEEELKKQLVALME